MTLECAVGTLLDAFDYPLPPECIAQHPPPRRDAARMLVLDRARPGPLEHAVIGDLPSKLRAGDLLVVNATRVVPARLRGRKQSGGRAEALLLGPAGTKAQLRALVGCRGRLREGLALIFESERQAESLEAEVLAVAPDGVATLAFPEDVDPYAWGAPPLPPYIRREPGVHDADDVERYQTIFAREPGAVAAPTAGLHFTKALLGEIAERGVARAEVVLHVGAGTFRPLTPEDLQRGRLHAEDFELPEETAEAIERTRAGGGRVVAVGTTVTRVLEACHASDGRVAARRGQTDLFLKPGSRFAVVDALLTNFHLPRSSLLLLVAAFAGRETVLAAYAEAIREGYRFYSYGDAMWIE
ncbi:MAG: tRNA preQ1(34) S-adenosylmethionine ribosyltransferase-isomerase QueA [Myxococcota bacterium]